MTLYDVTSQEILKYFEKHYASKKVSALWLVCKQACLQALGSRLATSRL